MPSELKIEEKYLSWHNILILIFQVATSSSDLNSYKIPKVTLLSANNDYYEGDTPMSEVTPPPVLHIPGAPRLTNYHVLNDKRHILTKDSENNVALYDVLKVSNYLRTPIIFVITVTLVRQRSILWSIFWTFLYDSPNNTDTALWLQYSLKKKWQNPSWQLRVDTGVVFKVGVEKNHDGRMFKIVFVMIFRHAFQYSWPK